MFQTTVLVVADSKNVMPVQDIQDIPVNHLFTLNSGIATVCKWNVDAWSMIGKDVAAKNFNVTGKSNERYGTKDWSIDWGLTSQSNHGYDWCCRVELQIIICTWGFFNVRRNLDTRPPWLK